METYFDIGVLHSLSYVSDLNLVLAGERIFGASILYVVGFLGKLLLIFSISAFISKLLKLDKIYDN